MSFVDIQDIVLVQRENNSTVIYTRQDSFTTSAGLGDIEAKLDPEPVSYTHLDVYKRQIPAACREISCSVWMISAFP